jgi:hypothetical protein
MKARFFAVVLFSAFIGQINTASAQGAGTYYGSYYYYYGSPAALCCTWSAINLGWAYTRGQPPGDGAPYPAMQMADGTLACLHSNYRPFSNGLCRRIW